MPKILVEPSRGSFDARAAGRSGRCDFEVDGQFQLSLKHSPLVGWHDSPDKGHIQMLRLNIGKKLLTCYLLSQTKVNLSLFSLSNLKILFLATNDFCEKIFLLLLTCTPIRRCSKFVFHRILPMAPQPCWEDDFDHRIVSANCILESHNKNDDGFEGLVLSNKRVQAYSTQTNDQAEAKFCWQSYEKLLRWKNFFGLCVCCLN